MATGDLPTGKSAAAATLSMAKNEAITITMIFMMLSLSLDTQTVDRVMPQFAPLATAVEQCHRCTFLIFRRARLGALQHS